MSILCVSLGLNRAENEYVGLWQSLRAFRGYCRVHRSAWFIQAAAEPDTVAKTIRKHLASDDELLVFPADLSSWAARGLDKAVTDWMEGTTDRPDGESAVLCVSFELNGDESEYADLWETLRTAPAYCRIHGSAWLLQSGASAAQVRDVLKGKIQNGDRLVVFPADLSDWSSYCLGEKINKWLQHAGNHQSQKNFWTALARQQVEMYAINRVFQFNNEILQDFSRTMNNINAGWNEISAQNRAQQHEQHMRTLRAMGGSCPGCGYSCCRCHC